MRADGEERDANADKLRSVPPEWMEPVDIRVVNLMRREGRMTPATVESENVCVSNTASQSLRRLTRHGFATRLARGHYELSDEGWYYVLGLDYAEADVEHES